MFPTDAAPLWATYAHHQSQLDEFRCDARTMGREEQLDEILNCIAQGESFSKETGDRLQRLPWNRSKKHLRLIRNMRLQTRTEGQTERRFELADIRDEWRVCANRYDAALWPLEVALSEDAGMTAMADRLGSSPSALKMRLHRARLPFRTTDRG